MMNGFGDMEFSWLVWLIIIAIVWIVFRFKSKNHGHYYTADKIPMKILKERYANGEISREEFERMKKDLM